MDPKKVKILFVEDDKSLAQVTKDSLELQEYEVRWVEDGQKGWDAYKRYPFDVCILDVMLPKMDGFQLAAKIRSEDQQIPILFLTAKSMQEDKIAGLKLGADDYLSKPFSVEELILKVEIFLKRSKTGQDQSKANVFQLGEYLFDFENLNLTHPDFKKQLTLREAEVLRFFCQNPNVIVKREEILKKIWGEDDYFMGRSLDVFITRLRKYLKQDANIKIENIPTVGFKMQLNH